ncbi:hypothetical protein [Arthrobacter sp. Marseille-P9274]|uniref:hypothetical protein n=1 Tax=Arthrobacter sp. Marseille-P9274 TaxID=2866572 RepID=UPI0021C8F973|nr:hypothetical protein [Arthrobacter sp. Marseille-P9274]
MRRALLISGATVGLALLGVSAAQAAGDEPGGLGGAIATVTEAVEVPASEAGAHAAEPVQEVDRAASPVAEAAVPVAGAAQPLLDKATASAVPAAAAVFEPAGQTAHPITATVAEPVGQMAQPTIAALAEPVDAVSRPVLQAVRPVTGAVTEVVSDVAQPALEAARPVLASAGGSVESVAGQLDRAVAPIEESLESATGGAASAPSADSPAPQQVEPVVEVLSKGPTASADLSVTAAPELGKGTPEASATALFNVAGPGIVSPVASVYEGGSVLRDAAANAGTVPPAESQRPAHPVQPALPAAGPSGALAGAGPASGSAPADIAPGTGLDPRLLVHVLPTGGWTLPSSPSQSPGSSPD